VNGSDAQSEGSLVANVPTTMSGVISPAIFPGEYTGETPPVSLLTDQPIANVLTVSGSDTSSASSGRQFAHGGGLPSGSQSIVAPLEIRSHRSAQVGSVRTSRRRFHPSAAFGSSRQIRAGAGLKKVQSNRIHFMEPNVKLRPDFAATLRVEWERARRANAIQRFEERAAHLRQAAGLMQQIVHHRESMNAGNGTEIDSRAVSSQLQGVSHLDGESSSSSSPHPSIRDQYVGLGGYTQGLANLGGPNSTSSKRDDLHEPDGTQASRSHSKSHLRGKTRKRSRRVSIGVSSPLHRHGPLVQFDHAGKSHSSSDLVSANPHEATSQAKAPDHPAQGTPRTPRPSRKQEKVRRLSL